ncbi:hypothetical protein [Streptomyces gilvus]|uniref:hypothetical protein n=1 Tax=Streptomyces gilvus TaxID=2920937 RepID=UPI001F0D14DD|nr:hypothetical protein [Streptomyces sp. CME 23]MCH5676506.1 hypothetical protein [Streptomyces sp. CME 23]
MTADDRHHDGGDALMAAITGERLPEDADAALLAEHRRAEADVTLLREQLGIIGNALAGEQPRPRPAAAPPRPARNRRAVRRFAFAGLAVAAVAGVLSGMIWLLGQASGGGVNSLSGGRADSGAKSADSAARSPFASPEYLACARLVAEGTVTAAGPAPAAAGQERITLRVTRAYKPATTRPENTGKEITFVVAESVTGRALHRGDHILVAFPRRSATPDQVLVGEASIAPERAGLQQALAQSAGLTCE